MCRGREFTGLVFCEIYRNNFNNIQNILTPTDGDMLKFLGESDFETATESESGSDGETASDSDEENINEGPTRPPTTPTPSDWSDAIRTANVCAFKLQPGLKVTPQGKSPVDFFNLLFTPPLFEFMVKNINDRVSEILSKREDGSSDTQQWKEVTLDEFYTFLGLLLYTGTINTARDEDHWKGEELFHVPDLNKYMSRDRWWFIVKCLNFEDKTPGINVKLSKVSYMINYFNNVMKKVIVPEKILCIDGSLPNTNDFVRMRNLLKQCVYLLLADRFGLVHSLQVYKASHEGKAYFIKVVKQLLEDRLDVGHSVYMEVVFTSLELAKFLASRNTHVTGPLERDSEGNPLEVTGQWLEKDQKITKYNSVGISVTKWRSKHTLLMISTEHSGEWQDHLDKRKGCIRAPVCAVEYKMNHTGIKKHEDMMSFYNCEDVSRVWHKKVGIHILQMLLLNAHMMHNRYGDKAMLLEDFRKVVITHLLTRGEQTALIDLQ